MVTDSANLQSPDVRERYFTVREVAQRLRVNELTVRRWLRLGELRGIRLGNTWRVTDADLQAFLDKRRPETKEES